MASFGDIIRRAMAAHGEMEGQALAELIGKSASYVSKIINNNLKETPTPETLAALERVLGVSQTEMLAAWGYAVQPGGHESFPFDSERAMVATILPTLEEKEARILRRTAQILIEERDAKTVAAAEEYALAAVNSVKRQSEPTT